MCAYNPIRGSLCNRVIGVTANSWLNIRNHAHKCTAADAITHTPSDKSADIATEWQQARPFNELPRAGVFKFLRQLLPGGRYYKLDSAQLLKAMQEDYGDIYIMPGMFGRPDALYTHNPADFERVFRNEGAWPIRPNSVTLRYHRNKLRADFYGDVEGILATHGEQWSSFRTVVNPLLMQPKNIKIYLNKMAQVNQEFVERIRLIRDTKTLEMPDDFKENIQHWTLESVALVALDKQLGLLRENSKNLDDASKLFAALTDWMYLTLDLEYTPSLWRIVATPKFKRLMRALDDIQEVTSKYTMEAIAKLEEEQQRGIEREENEKSILEKLLKIDRKIATVMAMDLLLGGVDTTTSLTVGILLCLAKNPDKQEKLREEVKRILPQKNGVFAANTLNKIPYLRACLKEALRMYPVTIGNCRVPQKDVVLSGYRVPKGTVISMIHSTLLKSEEHYARPLEYLPERWLRPSSETVEEPGCGAIKDTKQWRASSPFAFLPFGVGPRACLGRRISDLEIELGVARLVRNFQIEFHYPTDNVFKNMLINMPNAPLKFKFIDIE
ncbi:cytochrome P450 CYP12A2 [Bactrocera dorsalis]|uniref:Cytochrome P450 CYP12A2 n=1 Tax=Bactrocera dorsalis TaxID=27457 RepID=A0A6I9V2D1_BACDO|nr:cytochrome P450 CYP12A2 [Bactrocera dorsalis]